MSAPETPKEATHEAVAAEMKRIRATMQPGSGGDREDLISYAKEVVRLRAAPATDAESERLTRERDFWRTQFREEQDQMLGYVNELNEALARPSDPHTVEEARREAAEDVLDGILDDLVHERGFWKSTDVAAKVLPFYGAMLPADRQRARDGQSEGGAKP